MIEAGQSITFPCRAKGRAGANGIEMDESEKYNTSNRGDDLRWAAVSGGPDGKGWEFYPSAFPCRGVLSAALPDAAWELAGPGLSFGPAKTAKTQTDQAAQTDQTAKTAQAAQSGQTQSGQTKTGQIQAAQTA